jgi:Ca2+-binding RTX toxin-like protein
VDNIGDIVDESLAGSTGFDRVNSSVSVALFDTAHFKGAVEMAVLTGTANLAATGNALNNILQGNSGHNVLNGGVGADIMRGGAGNDTYAVDNAGDVVDESLAGSNGYDRVYSSVDVALWDTAHFKGAVEMAVLTGSANTSATGNALNNVLDGNSGANVLNGGVGADLLRGGAGGDTYVVDNAGDIIDESIAGSNGFDRVNSSVSVALFDTAHVKGDVEAAVLTGTGNANAVGNILNNIVRGNAGNNVINGGFGNDILSGGAGADTFAFTTVLHNTANVDTIEDFAAPADTIQMENAVFAALGAPGTLAATAFHVGFTAATAGQHILYANGNGWLLYDADGNGSGAAIHFATIDAGLAGAISNTDFLVV